VVDDYRDAAETLARLLETMGCSVNFVTDPTAAVEAVAAMDAQVVFMDLGMPAVNGFELAEMFRTRYGQSIRLSGRDRAGARQLPTARKRDLAELKHPVWRLLPPTDDRAYTVLVFGEVARRGGKFL